MPAEERDSLGGFERGGEELLEEHSSLDELARGLATGALSRRQALKMAAIQALHRMIQDKDEQIDALRAELDSLKSRIDETEERT